MKSRIFLLLCCAIIAFAGCEKYEAQFEGPYNDDSNPGVLPAPYEIVFAQDGEIWMLDNTFSRPKRLATSLGVVELVSINYAHDRIAYKVAGEDIKIMDTEGGALGSVFNSKTISWFDWHQNGQTLYMLDGMTIKFYGPAVSVPMTNLNSLFPPGVAGKVGQLPGHHPQRLAGVQLPMVRQSQLFQPHTGDSQYQSSC